MALVVKDPRRNAAQPEFQLLVVPRNAVLARLGQLSLQNGQLRDAVARLARQAGAGGVGTNTLWVVILMPAINIYNLVLMRNFFEGIPTSLFESATLDGCSPIQIFYKIVLPLSKPICSVIAIFAINAAWSDFLLPYLVLRGSALQTVMVRLFVFSTEQTVNADTMMRSVVFSMIPPIILFFIFQKQLTENAVSVGIKG